MIELRFVTTIIGDEQSERSIENTSCSKIRGTIVSDLEYKPGQTYTQELS